MFCAFWLAHALRATAACICLTSWLQKVSETLSFFILTLKCASRHSGVQFFDSATSKSGPNPSVFFSILTCKRASRHSCVQFLYSATSKSGPNPSVTCKRASRYSAVQFVDILSSKSGPNSSGFIFWLGNVLRATAANFWTAQLQKVVRTRQWLANVLLATAPCNLSTS